MPFKKITEMGKKKPEITSAFDILSNTIKNRRSVRSYEDKPVSDDLIEKILDSARYAPSAGNRQPWEFIVVKNKDMKNKLIEAAFNQEWMRDVPVFIVACINMKIASATYGERGTRLYCIQSIANAIQNMLLTAESLGLNTCWIGAFSESAVSILLECPEYVRACAIITLGYGKEKPDMPKRLPIEEIGHKEKFGNVWKKSII